MKTSEEMARSVLGRAKAKRAAQKRILLTGVATVLCACGIGVGAWMAGRSPARSTDTLQASPTEPGATTARVMLMNYTTDGIQRVDLEPQIQTPFSMELRLWDIRDMTEDAVKTLVAQEEQYVQTQIQDYPGEKPSYSWYVQQYPNAVVAWINTGHFFVEIQDYKKVENLQVSLSGGGTMSGINSVDQSVWPDKPVKDFVMDYFHVAIECYQFGGVILRWLPGWNEVRQLGKDPTLPLSSLCDTMTVTVNMKDGTKQVIVVDIQVNDDGTVFATSREQGGTL